ncbi:hypothetical protein TPL01_21870 [Sulfuriferula plumbiphila]|uniref:DUF2933 domain-containing protein n=1 Tax=Sulfuriferula plumbiphila TaxID=171865 RepID=A0A512L991_9PROT|nr:DUF2933 domain-containing protein [Sulfuriferula plumbiphila]BBP03029.1 hypothetical protein SFPGR_04510 [Sulfuriferula plumbiphila]GEP31049.1 hypothetical protein TPL01_21870 [Sulfuriferula plumbiphila]
MEWFSQNWVWVLFFAGMIAMHMFGHGGGSGGGHKDPKPSSKDREQRASKQGPDHQH